MLKKINLLGKKITQYEMKKMKGGFKDDPFLLPGCIMPGMPCGGGGCTDPEPVCCDGYCTGSSGIIGIPGYCELY
jgi:hypothetical protein